MTRPTPSLARPELPALDPELRTDTDRDVELPDSERDSRPDTDRRDCEERDDARDDARELELELCEPREPLLVPAIPVGGDDTMPFGETTGASPHVSQYSSPPPMSS
ncbi:hypothetical protein [Streptomyces longispororuber]|uniref:hypothetical protein n=1 Tax=Streptomyces longispororuber TaxID=68230 RepID=UPI00403FCCF4